MSLSTNELITALTSVEGDTLTILAADPEAFEVVVTIDVCGAWTNWKEHRYVGPDLDDALGQAEIIKRIHENY